MPDPRPCCILGVCCPPGSAEQKAEFKAWLMEKVGLSGEVKESSPPTEADIDRWLDKLFTEGIEG